MRKILTLFIILFVGVICSACVNTFAVHELNQMALDYINKGEIDKAISRLEASIDLDSEIFDTRYNLALAYLKKEECSKAQKEIDYAKNLNKNNEPEVYYTSGVINNCLAEKIMYNVDENGEKIEIIFDTPEQRAEKLNEYVNLLVKSNDDLTKYLELANLVDDSEEIKNLINLNNSKIEESTKSIQ